MIINNSSLSSININFDELKKHVNLIGSVVIAIDKDGTIVLINQKGYEVIDCTSTEVVGKNWITDFIPDSEKS